MKHDSPGHALLDAMLHPIRLRAIQELTRGPRSTSELAERLADVPASSLYRHMKALRDAGIVTVEERRPARGAIERVYTLARAARLSAEDVASISDEDHTRYFTTYAHTLIERFASYAAPQPTLDMVADRVGYTENSFWATDDEFDAELDVIRGAFERLRALEPSPERRARVFATITHPEFATQEATDE